MANLPIIVSVEGVGAAHQALQSVAKDAKAAGGAVGTAGKTGAAGMAKSSKQIKTGNKDLIKHAAAASVAVAGLQYFTNSAITAGDEAEGAGLKLEQMLAKRGQSSSLGEMRQMGVELSKISGIDDDKLSNVAAHMLSFGLNAKQIREVLPGLIGQAKTMDQPLESVADSFGKAFASGNIGMLKRAGMTFSQVDIKAVGAAKKISEAAGQLELFARVQGSLKEFALNAGGGQSESQLTRKFAQNQLGNTMEGIGQAAGRTRAGWQGALTPLATKVAASPGATNALGFGLEMANMAAPFVAMLATAGQSMPAINALQTGMKNFKTGVMVATVAEETEGIGKLAFAVKTKIAAAATATMGMSAGALTLTLGAFVLAAGAVAWAIDDIKKSAADMKLGDEAYAKKRGVRGGIELDAARGASSLWDSVTGKNRKGANLEAQMAAQNEKNRLKFHGKPVGARQANGSTKSRVTVTINHPQTPAERGLRAY